MEVLSRVCALTECNTNNLSELTVFEGARFPLLGSHYKRPSLLVVVTRDAVCRREQGFPSVQFSRGTLLFSEAYQSA